MGTIYKVTNTINGKIYIGKTMGNVSRRKIDHIKKANNNPKYYFHKAMAKYGIDNFLWESIDEAPSDEDLCNKERMWIKHYESNNLLYGYNLTDGGDGRSGFKRSKSTCDKISRSKKGKKPSEATRKKMSLGRMGIRPNEETRKKLSLCKLGQVQSAESRKKNSISNTGQKRSEQTKINMSIARMGIQKGKFVSKETGRKISASKLAKHYKHTEEWKIKHSQMLTGRKHSAETINKMKNAWVIRKQNETHKNVVKKVVNGVEVKQ